MIDDEALVNLRVVQPSDAEIVKTVTDLPRKSWTAWLAYPKEARSLPQPLLDNQTGRKLKATNPNLLAAENAGLLFPAFSPGHDVYATHLAEPLCLPSGIIITRDNCLFSETFRTPKSFLQPDVYVPRNGLRHVTGTGNFDVLNSAPKQNWERLTGWSFFLDGDHFGSFGHMLGEILTRLWYFIISGADAGDFNFICGHG